jgi:hypothetical protein
VFGENVARELARLVDPRAACAPLFVKLPAGASFRRVRFYIWGQLDSNPPSSQGYRDKAVNDLGDWSKFGSPEIIDTAAGPIVTSIAKNWSHDHSRYMVMHLVYTPASFQEEKERKAGTIDPTPAMMRKTRPSVVSYVRNGTNYYGEFRRSGEVWIEKFPDLTSPRQWTRGCQFAGRHDTFD